MNLFELFVKIGVDDQASDKISSLSSKLGSGLATAAKVGAAAVTAAAGAVASLTKASIDGYADYEQLVGGVETLFKQSADVVQGYAANAYKTAGLSANEYMETVTSFSASLLQSLDGDTAAAAEKADLAITDMADNANKMGTSMESIQNAYQGFAKQNYTMLDNLKLGYGGTKEEMQRLIADAAELSDTVDAQSMSFENIVEAIHVVQTEMGITGTTAKEASSTIQGSIASMKSAWSNLVTGIADENADLDALIGNFVDSVATAGENIIPRVEQILAGIGEAIAKLAPVISESVPSLVTNVLPTLLDAGVQLIDGLLQGLITALPALAESAVSIVDTLATTIVEQLPALLKTAMEVIVTLANGIAESLPELIPTIVDVVIQIVETLIDNVDMLVDAAIAITVALAEGLINALPTLIEKAPEIVGKLVDAVIENAPKLLDAAFEIIKKLAAGLADNFPKIVAAGKEIVEKIISGIGELFDKLVEKGKDIIDEVKSGIKKKIDDAKQWGKDLIQNFIDGITAKFTALKEKISSIAQTVKDFLGFSEPKEGPLSNFHTYAPDMMNLFIKGIKDNEKKLRDQIRETFDFGEQTISAGISYGSYANSGISGGGGYGVGRVSVVQNIYSEAKTAADLMQEALYQQERAVLLGV